METNTWRAGVAAGYSALLVVAVVTARPWWLVGLLAVVTVVCWTKAGANGQSAGVRTLGRRRASATPTRHSTPPTYAIVGGTSESSTQLITTVIGGTR